jgi:radical SAM-linked protein
MTPGEYRLRVCFAKRGRLRWLSHLEVLRAIERMVRRSKLPVAVTQGFHPHMKIAFGPALPVGTAGLQEYADVWLTRYTDVEVALESLSRAAPEDLSPLEVWYVAERSPSLTAALTVAWYRVEVDGEEIESGNAYAGLERLFEAGTLEVVHKGKTKVFELARSVPKDVRIEGSERGVVFELPIRMGPEGSLRPEALIRAALADSASSISAVRTTRLDLLVEEDEGVWSRPV